MGVKKKILSLLTLLVLVSCGDNSPFDEDYWGTPTSERTDEEVDNVQNFTADINSLSETVLNINGNVKININQTDVSTSTQIIDIPQSLIIGQRSISSLTCSEIALSFPLPEIVNNTLEFKEIQVVDNGSRESLVAELNQDNPQNGESVNLVGKSYVIKAYIENLNTPSPLTVSLVPVACGAIVVQNDETGPSTTGGATGGTTSGGTISGTIGGTTSGF